MEKNYLVRILENEERINKIVEVLSLSPAKHFQISYTDADVEIDAYSQKSTSAQHVENLMRCFAIKTDRIETIELENSNGKFWVSKLYISI